MKTWKDFENEKRNTWSFIKCNWKFLSGMSYELLLSVLDIVLRLKYATTVQWRAFSCLSYVFKITVQWESTCTLNLYLYAIMSKLQNHETQITPNLNSPLTFIGYNILYFKVLCSIGKLTDNIKERTLLLSFPLTFLSEIISPPLFIPPLQIYLSR